MGAIHWGLLSPIYPSIATPFPPLFRVESGMVDGEDNGGGCGGENAVFVARVERRVAERGEWNGKFTGQPVDAAVAGYEVEGGEVEFRRLASDTNKDGDGEGGGFEVEGGSFHGEVPLRINTG